jgi:hypothetical protein
MAKSTSKVRATETITISFPDQADPHAAVFSGPKRVHVHGHIWLKPEPDGALELPFKLDPQCPGYSFVSRVAGDGSHAIFISNKASSIRSFRSFDVFSKPTLTENDTLLKIVVQKFDSNKYFYILNIVDPGGTTFSLNDPIIVNR